MKLFSMLLNFIFLSCWITIPTAALAQSDVHFGTIFVEDVEVENSDDRQKVNHLTDQSQKQLELETLYRRDIGDRNEKLKKLDFVPRSPSATDSNEDRKLTNKVGVIRNSEMPKQIIYFIELRSFAGNGPKTVHQFGDPTSPRVFNLQPGEIVKITDSPDQYIHKLRMDRDNQGLWKKITTREQDIQHPQVYYDWRNFDTITSHDFPVELDILVPYGKNSIPVFNRPGAWTWKDCGISDDLCLDTIDLHTKAYLFDSTIVDIRQSFAGGGFNLFYKIGYQITDKDGIVQHKVGWIPSAHAKRKISQLPKSLVATRSPDSFGTYESDSERLQRLQKYYVFDANMHSENRTMNRWLASTPGQSSEVFFQNIAIDAVANFNTFHLEQSFLDKEFDQKGVAVGLGIFAPIFIDLEIQGTATVTVPISATQDETFEKVFLFKGEQWLLYTTPLSIGGSPFKFGIGGYYSTMFASQKSFGFNSLVGFQAKGLVESSSFWTGVRYGPTGQDFSFRFENREIGAELGIRLNPERKYESWSIYGDFSDTSYTSESKNSTKFQIIQLGIRKQF